MKITFLRSTLAACAALVMTACGGGGSGVANNSTGAVGAVTQTSAVTGTITGFGSVHVNGIHFNTNSAAISRNGAPALQSDLRVGQVVKVRGSVNDSTREGVASSVSQDDNVEGPISSIDVPNKKFVVLGQTVIVDTDTSFDDRISPASIAGLKVNDQVEVSGMVGANGDITATRIELRKPGVTQLEVTGKVSNLDSANRKFKINALTVNYSTAQLEGFATGAPANDDLVEARGNALNAAGELVATKVEKKTAEARDADRGDRRELEGMITRFASKTDFDVAGRKVTTNASTRYENGTENDLALNVRLEVEGSLDAAGLVLVAAKIEFRRGGGAAIAGKVDSVDKANKKLTVMGVEITLTATTRLEDKSTAKVEMFSIDNINSGDYVRVRGIETGANRLTATRLERRNAITEVRVRGTARDVAAPRLTVLGVPVETNAGTRFEIDDSQSMTATQFFASAAGRVVTTVGTWSGNSLTASKVEFEDED
jgi:hypothetical protein